MARDRGGLWGIGWRLGGGEAFTGLTADQNTDFTSVTGAFGIQWQDPTAYLEIYARSAADDPQ